MSRIISYIDVIDIMKNIAERHYLINSFFLGKDWELTNNGDISYPVLQVYPEIAKMPINDYNQYKTLEFTLKCKVLDLVSNGEINKLDVDSDTLRISQDIVNELNAHPFYVRSNVSLIEDITFTNLDENNDDSTNGWGFELKLRVINANTFCGMPISELPGFSADGPTSSGDYVYTDWRGPTGAAGYQGSDGATGPAGPTLGLSASLSISNSSGTYSIDMNYNKIERVGTGSTDGDAVNYTQMNSTILAMNYIFTAGMLKY